MVACIQTTLPHSTSIRGSRSCYVTWFSSVCQKCLRVKYVLVCVQYICINSWFQDTLRKLLALIQNFKLTIFTPLSNFIPLYPSLFYEITSQCPFGEEISMDHSWTASSDLWSAEYLLRRKSPAEHGERKLKQRDAQSLHTLE